MENINELIKSLDEFLKNLDPASFGLGMIIQMLIGIIISVENYLIEKAKLLYEKRKEIKKGK